MNDSNSRPVSKPEFWRSLGELEGTPEFQEFVEREFAAPLENCPPNSPERRRFMQLMGASFALAGLTGCRWEKENILPHTRRPQGAVPDGEPRAYATSVDFLGASIGLHVTSVDGRPIKVEGHPEHPYSLGAALARHQGSILELYDPDRSQAVIRLEGGGRAVSSWEDFDRWATEHFQALKAKGSTVRVLSESSSSPSLMAAKRRFLEAFPGSQWVEFEPVSRDQARQATALAFGKPLRAHLRFEKADVIAAFEDDVMTGHPAGLLHARRIAERRSPEGGNMSRIYVAESSFSTIGALSDERLPVRSEQIAVLIAALDARLSEKLKPVETLGPAQPTPKGELLDRPEVVQFLDELVKDLVAHAGKSLVTVGAHQPAAVQAIALRINAVLGNVGQTIIFTEDVDGDRVPHHEALKGLVDDLKAKRVDTLVILGGNPAATAPGELGLAEAFTAASQVIRLGLYEDETSEKATWHLPQCHFLEAWGDGRAFDGSITIAQPLIAPLYGSRSALDFVASLLGDQQRGPDLVKRTHAAFKDERRWRRAVHDGMLPGTAWQPVEVETKPLAAVSFEPRQLAADAPAGQLEVVFAPDAKLFDGRHANNGWLQEMPDPITKLTWGNAALLAPATADALKVRDGEVVRVKLGSQALELPAMHAPGQARGSVRLSLGYGRTAAGKVGGSKKDNVAPVGVSVVALQTAATPFASVGASIEPTGKLEHLATTQDLHAIDQMGREGRDSRLPMIIRSGTLAEFKKHPDFAKHVVHHPPLLQMWNPPVSYEGRKWGMSVDLNKCMGCGSCVVACQAENNIPVVGKEQVQKGREMHWIRVDRYYKGTPESPKIAYQPLTCQQCENAPCEQVCPVGATMHSDEGLNDMVYNRCIGTRYCSNNCPYKVRRFNYFNFNLELQDPKSTVRRMGVNPEVTVRVRGVMEKCTFCVQRIQNVKIKAKNAKRPIKDGEIKTACQQTCPTQAISFGDLNDPRSDVLAQHSKPRSYELLGEFNNRPRLKYLAQVTNPVHQPEPHDGHGGHGAHGAAKDDHGSDHGKSHGSDSAADHSSEGHGAH